MKKEINGFIIGFLLTVFLIGSPVLAAEIYKTIKVQFNAINLEINGQKVEADNILYNGTTYVPFRKVAEILDKDVQFVSETRTAKITDKPGSTSNVLADFGSIRSSDGIYTGELYNGMKHGYGIMNFTNNDSYIGYFEHNALTGKGKYKYTNGDIYEGNFVNGVKQGWGTYTFANGDIYKGFFSEGKMAGFGSYYSAADKSLFVGSFEEGLASEYGFYQYENGTFKFSQFNTGNPVGDYATNQNGIINIYRNVNGQETLVK